MPSPPFAIPAGQSLVYCYAGTWGSSAGTHCSASASQLAGANNQSWTGPLGGPYTTATSWSNFIVPPILSTPGTVIHSINPYIVFNSFFDYAQMTSAAIDGNDLHTTPNGSHALYFTHSPNTLSTIPAITAFFNTEGTLSPPGGGIFGGPINDFVTTSFVAIAVYATIPQHADVTIRAGLI